MDEDGNVLAGRSVTWSSGNTEVASVSSTGEVTALSPGTADIRATSEGKTGSVAVTVMPPPIHSITVVVVDPNLSVGSSTQASAIVKDANGNVLTGRPIVWTTDNPEVATVSPQGVVTGVKAGTATITATSDGRNGNATVTIGADVSQVIVALRQPGLAVGFSLQASDTVSDAAGNRLEGRTVAWSSSNTAVATVNQSGVVTGVSVGTADIIATSGGKTGSATIGIVVIRQQPLSAGYTHTCAISVDGDAYCWGYNGDGQLGDGTTTDRLSPARVAGELKFSAIASKGASTYGGSHTYALTSDGRLVCWGACPGFQTLSPRQVETRRAIYLLGNGMSGHCSIGVGNIAYCWGNNEFGQLGTGSTGGTTTTPEAPVAGNRAWVDIGSGGNHACAITDEGKPYCWGYAALGNGNQVDQSSVPKPVANTYIFNDIAAGDRHSCGLNPTGATSCWGFPGRTGVPREYCETHDGGCSIPVEVQGGYVFESISSGYSMTCGVTPPGDIYCWGLQPYGETAISFRHWSATVEGDPYALVKYRIASPGAQHVCATSTEGDAYCMNHHGYGNRTDVGHLGDGTTDISRAVRKVIGGIKFRVP